MSDSDFVPGSGMDARRVLAQLERSVSGRVDSWAELDHRMAELLGVCPEDLQAFREVLQVLDRFTVPPPAAP